MPIFLAIQKNCISDKTKNKKDIKTSLDNRKITDNYNKSKQKKDK